jgi:N6-adenosine-specific RNA methylase IME4
LKKYQEKPTPIPYETMSVEEIKALNVADLADEDCELYLWTTQKYLPDAFEVLKAW